MTRPELDSKDEEFGPYAQYLGTELWPSAPSSIGQDLQIKACGDLVPQYAAAALCKLVRWARYAPTGDAVQHPSEEGREEYARISVLGMALAARACGMHPDHFHAVYGEMGLEHNSPQAPALAPGKALQVDRLLGEVIVSLAGCSDLEGWPVPDLAELAGTVLKDMFTRYDIKEQL